MAITTTTATLRQYDGAALIGRILLAAIFIISGFAKIGGFDGTGGFIASKGLPMPQVLTAVTILIELGGGIMLVLGWRARWAAIAIAVFTLLAAFIFHNYWTYPDAERMSQFNSFWKNIAIVGGMLMTVAFGPGRFSIDRG